MDNSRKRQHSGQEEQIGFVPKASRGHHNREEHRSNDGSRGHSSRDRDETISQNRSHGHDSRDRNDNGASGHIRRERDQNVSQNRALGHRSRDNNEQEARGQRNRDRDNIPIRDRNEPISQNGARRDRDDNRVHQSRERDETRSQRDAQDVQIVYNKNRNGRNRPSSGDEGSRWDRPDNDSSIGNFRKRPGLLGDAPEVQARIISKDEDNFSITTPEVQSNQVSPYYRQQQEVSYGLDENNSFPLENVPQEFLQQPLALNFGCSPFQAQQPAQYQQVKLNQEAQNNDIQGLAMSSNFCQFPDPPPNAYPDSNRVNSQLQTDNNGQSVENSNNPRPDNSSGTPNRKSKFYDLPSLNPKVKNSADLKSQIKELKDYILLIENEKKDESQDNSLESEKVQQLRDYIMKVEVDKQELIEKLEVEKRKMEEKNLGDTKMIDLIKQNIEKVKEAQVIEKKKIEVDRNRIEEEKGKLVKAKADIKESIGKGMNILSTEKNKMETEVNEKQMQLLAKERMAFSKRISELQQELTTVKQSKESEEKRHLAAEVDELETRKEMTKKAIDSELLVEELEAKLEDINNQYFEKKQTLSKKTAENKNLISELAKVSSQNEELSGKFEQIQSDHNGEISKLEQEKQALQRKQEVELSIYCKKKEEFDESDRLRCVFCPGENLQTVSNYMFHIAREHMFDQYKTNNRKEESVQVGMYFKILEDKAKKESANELNNLKDLLDKAKETSSKVEEVNKDNNEIVTEMKEKISVLEQDIETLLEVEANQKNQIDNLVTRNNTLTNQIRSSINNETLRIERQETNRKINILSKEITEIRQVKGNLDLEIHGMRQRLKQEYVDKQDWKNKHRNMITDLANGKTQIQTLERVRDTLKSNIRKTQETSRQEKEEIRKKVKNHEGQIDELVNFKSIAEAQLLEVRAENEAIKEFRSDLNAINDVVYEDMRVENKTLKSKLESASLERNNLRSEVFTLKETNETINLNLSEVAKEVSELRMDFSDAAEENESLTSRLKEALQKVESYQRDLDGTFKDTKNVNDSSFNFGMGLDSILKAPLDMINIQIDNIDLEQLDKVDELDRSIDEESEEIGESNLQESGESISLENKRIPVRSEFLCVENVEKETVVTFSNDTSSKEVWNEEHQGEDCNSESKQSNHGVVEDSDTDSILSFQVDVSDSDEDVFDYSLLDSSQEDDDQSKEDIDNGSRYEIISEENHLKDKETEYYEEEHGFGCDCVECDQCDVLHGFVNGEAYGIREMMKDLKS